MKDATGPDYAMVTGQGRSGTIWLLDLFDRSPETFCRNEPYNTGSSPLAELEEDRFVVRSPADVAQLSMDRSNNGNWPPPSVAIWPSVSYWVSSSDVPFTPSLSTAFSWACSCSS